jgi:rod shape-determining protein MreD
MNWSRLVAPIGSVAVLTLIAALPLGIPAGDRFFLPLLPVIAIHYWTLRHDAWLPEWVVFLAGLTLDILTHGPVGYWAFIYLLAHLTATLSARLHLESSLDRLLLLGLAIVVITFAAWLTASIISSTYSIRCLMRRAPSLPVFALSSSSCLCFVLWTVPPNQDEACA